MVERENQREKQSEHMSPNYKKNLKMNCKAVLPLFILMFTSLGMINVFFPCVYALLFILTYSRLVNVGVQKPVVRYAPDRI